MSSTSFKPFIPPEKNLKEFTLRALVIGLFLAVLLGAANAYLGLKAGMTIAATYPAAVLGMALLRLFRDHNILEENIIRTVGSIGESVAAGAIFTLPAFTIAAVWSDEFFSSFEGYIRSSAIMLVGGIIGIMFVTLLRRVMVEDHELPFPESVAASEIHKAGRSGTTGAKYLFYAMGIGGIIQFIKEFKIFAETWEYFTRFGAKIIPGTSLLGEANTTAYEGVSTGGGFLLKTPSLSPAFLGVGYIIGPRLAALNFAGGVLAWGLFVPLIMLHLAPQFQPLIGQQVEIAGKLTEFTWTHAANSIFANIVKPIAIGGMLMAAIYTLYKMRASLFGGIKRSVEDVRKAATAEQTTLRTDRDINIKSVFLSLAALAGVTFIVYWWFMDFTGENLVPALVAALVMMVAGFFFAAVSGYLVGLIGSSNNPISGLTLTTLVVAALLMVMLGVSRDQGGVAVVLAVAGLICVSAAVAGEMLQDLKVGYILGGTPWRMQVGDLIGVFVSALVLWFPLIILNEGDLIKAKAEGYIGGFGGDVLAAPQAGLMAKLSAGIVGGDMVWPLIIVGIIMSIGFILLNVRSPMLVCVGMYLSFGTVAAIFVGGLIRGIIDMFIARRKLNDNQKSRVDNRGTLLASGLIAGEALMGLLFAGLAFFEVDYLKAVWGDAAPDSPYLYLLSIAVFFGLGYLLVKLPLNNAGDPDEPAVQANI
jgi:putative OPT family oligopeptide transporter